MRVYWYKTNYKNFGDELTPVVLGHLLTNEKIELAGRHESGKLLGIGSIMAALCPGDLIWGSGSNRPKQVYDGRGCKVLAVRGPLTAGQIRGTEVPEVYGDPALILPEIYAPKVEVKYKVGYIPHYVDKKMVKAGPGEIIIDILGDWRRVVDEILSCEMIVSSSLHGLIAAEAYGVLAVWAKYSDKIVGGDFKFMDYLMGTGRPAVHYGKDMIALPPIEGLAERKKNLIEALVKHYEVRE